MKWIEVVFLVLLSIYYEHYSQRGLLFLSIVMAGLLMWSMPMSILDRLDWSSAWLSIKSVPRLKLGLANIKEACPLDTYLTILFPLLLYVFTLQCIAMFNSFHAIIMNGRIYCTNSKFSSWCFFVQSPNWSLFLKEKLIVKGGHGGLGSLLYSHINEHATHKMTKCHSEVVEGKHMIHTNPNWGLKYS